MLCCYALVREDICFLHSSHLVSLETDIMLPWEHLLHMIWSDHTPVSGRHRCLCQMVALLSEQEQQENTVS